MHKLDRRPDLVALPDLSIRPFEVLTPYDAQHGGAGASLRQPIVHRAVASKLAARQIAQADSVSQNHLLGDGTPDSDLDSVRVRPKGQQIEPHVRTQTPMTGSSLTRWGLLCGFCWRTTHL